jgi:hypothetical protein
MVLVFQFFQYKTDTMYWDKNIYRYMYFIGFSVSVHALTPVEIPNCGKNWVYFPGRVLHQQASRVHTFLEGLLGFGVL